jgi:predicted RND superfamily exporter protein
VASKLRAPEFRRVTGVMMLLIFNFRGIREAVVPLVPVCLLFVLTHPVAIVYAVDCGLMNASAVCPEGGAPHHPA